MNDWEDLRCPLPKCGHEMWLRYDNLIGLSGFYYNRVEAPNVTDLDVSDWKVECLAGHVILTPGDIDLDDENPETVESDERRIFTKRDMQRLIDFLNLNWESVSA